jgi:hypothetical protein
MNITTQRIPFYYFSYFYWYYIINVVAFLTGIVHGVRWRVHGGSSEISDESAEGVSYSLPRLKATAGGALLGYYSNGTACRRRLR